jgi:hypothetical protein
MYSTMLYQLVLITVGGAECRGQHVSPYMVLLPSGDSKTTTPAEQSCSKRKWETCFCVNIKNVLRWRIAGLFTNLISNQEVSNPMWRLCVAKLTNLYWCHSEVWHLLQAQSSARFRCQRLGFDCHLISVKEQLFNITSLLSTQVTPWCSEAGAAYYVMGKYLIIMPFFRNEGEHSPHSAAGSNSPHLQVCVWLPVPVLVYQMRKQWSICLVLSTETDK